MNTSTPLVSYQIDVSKFGENNSLLKVKTTKLNDVNYTIVTLNESLAETTEKHSKEILPQEEIQSIKMTILQLVMQLSRQM